MTTSRATSAWAVRRERGSAFLIRFIAWLALTLGRSATRLLLYPITLYFLVFAPAPRRSSAAYLERIFGRPARIHEVFKHIQCFAATILDRVFFLTGRFELFDIELIGDDAIAKINGDGQGIILLGAHFGSFDAMRAISQFAHARDLKILMYEGNDNEVARVLAAINPAITEQIIPLGPPESLIKVRDALQDGDMVGILGDRITHGDKTVDITFLGGTMTVAAGPALLSAITDSPVIVFSAVYDGGNRYKVYMQELNGGVRGNLRDVETHRAFMQEFMDLISIWARRHPYNWFNFHDVWH